MIAYVLETIVCSALFLALYRLLVAGKVAPLPARIFLTGTMFLSAVIPALNLPILPARAQYVQIPVTAATAESLSAAAENPNSVSVWQVVAIAIYIAVTLVFPALLCRDLIKIARLRRKGTISRKGGYTLVENGAVTSPFTFWRTVFIGGGMEMGEREVVLAHESSHARHLHTVDKLLLSLLRAVYWFNPFYWMALSSLAQLQEWEADRDTLEGGVDLQTFRMTIFKQMFGYYPELTSALVQGPLKKRFAMMVKGIKSRRPALRLGAALPLAALLVVMFGATACPSPKKTQEAEPIQKNVSAVFVDSVGTSHKIEVDIKEVKQNDTLAGYEVNGRFIPKDSTLRIVPNAVYERKISASSDKKTVSVNPNMKRDTINDAVIVVRKGDSDIELTVNGVVVPKDSLKCIEASKIESVTVNRGQKMISVVLKDCTKRVRGMVKDIEGKPLQSVNIILVGYNLYYFTDANGKYEMMIPENVPDAKLEFSMIGKRTVAVPVTGGKMKDVILEDEPIPLPGTTITASVD